MNKTQLKDIIISDLTRYGFREKEKVNIVKKMSLHGYNYTKTLRKVKYYREKKCILRYLINRIVLELKSFIYGFQIPFNTKIGKGLYIGHFGRVIVNGDAILGDNINLSPGVTIGMCNRGKLKGTPTIGNNVWLGTNSIVVGNVKIGNNVMVAPNAFVNFNVPDNSIVIGNPGVIHYKENAVEFYVENIV